MADVGRRVLAVSALVVTLLAAAAGGSRADERVDVTAMDGVQLLAELGGTRGPGVVMVHDAGEDRSSWRATADAIVARGFRVLRVDLRGHGESGGARDMGLADRDVEGAYRYLLGRKIRPVFLVAKGGAARAVLAVAERVPTGGVVLVGTAGAPIESPATLKVLRLEDVTSPEVRTRLGDWLDETGRQDAR